MFSKKNLFKKIFIIITVFIVINILFTYNKISFKLINHLVSQETKNQIKKYIFPYKYINQIESFNELMESELETRRFELKELREILSQKDVFLSSIPNKIGFGEFYQSSTKSLEINDLKFSFLEFKEDFLEVKKAIGAKSGSIYAEKIDDKVIILSGNGYFQYFYLDDLRKSNFKTQIIKSNIKELINYDEFFTNSKYGVKDLFVMENKVYFSYVRKIDENCFNTSVLQADLNFEKLMFEDFFVPKECISSKNDWFQPHSSGGRMTKFEDKFLLSIGEYLDRNKAQNPKSIFGKIVVLDPKNKNNYNLISIGHRNVQGLVYDDLNRTIISTEHGPKGGDEININLDLEKKLNNFGWPISSYGEHYSPTPVNYEKFPLYKSHSKYGFKEPIKYFTPSIGISQIIKIDGNLMKNENNNFLIGALGNDPLEGDMSLHYIEISQNYKEVVNHEIININSRVRDIILLDEKNILCMLETNSTLGLLKFEN